ncbi:hypothetical protein [Candidatus Sodalis sp. SoCistrobi]|uniref:hypothetical protein n=1 Tax=Candidatus Sodalis sp. SoCistrobi TaxID=1922216 RepID=UPI00093BD886|nr:hypothetical protein [Candidatus Sodalis sp. SoCistrobi]
MKLDNARVLTFRHPNMGEVVAITDGGESIDDARYLVSLGRQPNEDWETQTLRAVIEYMAEDNKRLRKQVKRLIHEGCC